MKNYKLSILNSKKISNAKSDDQIRRLYETAFPEDEQIPWDDLMRLVGEMPLDFTAYYDGEDFIGFTIVYPRKQFNWYWYFAVREELRGKGYGQQILTQLIEKYKGQSALSVKAAPYTAQPSSGSATRSTCVVVNTCTFSGQISVT